MGSWHGVPIMAANMDTVGTFELAEVLAKRKCLTAIHKHYNLEDWKTWAATPSGKAALPFIAVSTGILASDMESSILS